MDDRLIKALEHANYRQALGIERQRLKDKAKAELVIAFNGGLFTVDRTLIGFITTIKDYGSAVILDDNDYPVEIEDLDAFQAKVVGTYFEVTNRYLTDYNQIKKNVHWQNWWTYDLWLRNLCLRWRYSIWPTSSSSREVG
jgi:hypothetical protein